MWRYNKKTSVCKPEIGLWPEWTLDIQPLELQKLNSDYQSHSVYDHYNAD